MKKKVLIGIVAGAIVLIGIILGIIFLSPNDNDGNTASTTTAPTTHTHIEVVDEAVAPTCTSTGLTEGKHCSACGEVIVAQKTVERIPHVESDWIVEVEPTKTSNGLKYVKCTVCSEKINEEVLYALGSEGLAYTLNDDGKSYYVTGIGTCTDIELVIPTMHDGLPVTLIGDYAFKDCTAITNVLILGTNISVLPKSYKQHVMRARSSSDDYSIVIGEGAFYGCTSLEAVEIPNDVTSIGNKAFGGCSALESITIPESVTNIGTEAFADCASLETITIPETVTNLGEDVFVGCDSLTIYCEAETQPEGWSDSWQGIDTPVNWDSVAPPVDEPDSPHTHTEVIDPAVAPTCTAEGKTEGKHCSECNEVLVEQQTISKVPHTYDDDNDDECNICGHKRDISCVHSEVDIIAGKEATCTTTGLTDGTKCKNCGKIITAQTIIPVKAHTEVIDTAIAATCTKTGLTEGKHCSVCNTVLVAQKTVDATGHTFADGVCHCGVEDPNYVAPHVHEYEATVIAPTCTAIGYTTYTCSCGDTYTDNETAALGHTTVVDDAVFATCTTTGLTEGSHCSVCNIIIMAQVETPTVDHTYDNEQDGTCNVCGFVRPVSCAHSVTEVLAGYDSTCTTTGLTDGTKCKNCGEIIIAQTTIPTKPHTEEIIPGSPANCMTTGLTEGKKCSVCGTTLVSQQTIMTTPHTEVIDSSVPATCVSEGKTEGKHCSVCETTIVAQYTIPKTEHTPGDWIVDKEASKAENGLRHKECSTCGETVNEEILYATGSVGLEYYIGTSNVYVVSGIGTCTDTDIVIPSTYNGLPVTYIEAYAFSGCTSLESIIIPDSVTSIDDYAFNGCTSLTSIEIPNSVKNIGGNAFNGCASLTSVVIPNSVTNINSNTFYGCSSLVNIEIPNSVTSIGDRAFYYCTSLTSVTIGESVTNIGDYAFAACTSLIEVCNESSLNVTAGSSDNGYVSYYAKHIITDETESTIKYVGDYIFYDDGTDIYIVKYLGKETEITLPEYDGGKEYGIWEYAFYNSDDLISVTILDSVTSIGYSAFSGCDALASVMIGDSVTSIGADAFRNCTSLINIEISNFVTSIEQYAFYNCKSLTSITIPNSVISIGNGAFSGCSSLESITLPFVGGSANATSISPSTLFGYIFGTESYTGGIWTKQEYGSWYYEYVEYYIPSNLKTVTITGGSLYYGAFSNCNSITTVILGDNVTSIGMNAFNSCKSLTSINIPDAVTTIGSYAFQGCESLTSIIIPNSVTRVGASAFCGCYSLSTVVLSESLTIIESYVFASCESLTNITIPKYVTSIEQGAFQYTALTSIDIPDRVTSIGMNAFNHCTSLVSIEIPESVTDIDYYAFEFCTSLTSVIIPESVDIGYEAFYNCYSLIEVCTSSNYISVGSTWNGYIGYYAKHIIQDKDESAIKYVGDYIFYDDGTDIYLVKYFGNDTVITLPEYEDGKNYEIWKYAFYNCDVITSVTIPDFVTIIPERAFAGCDNLVNVSLPSSMTYVSDLAFIASDSLKYSEYDNVYYLGNENNPYLVLIKAKDTNITDCEVHSDTKLICFGAFSGCMKLESMTLPFVGGSADAKRTDSIGLFGYIFGTSSFAYSEATTQMNADNNNPTYYIPITLKTIVVNGTDLCYGAFSNCKNIETIIIGDDVTSIGINAFNGCSSLTNIQFEGTMKQWNSVNKYSNWNNNTGNYIVYCTDFYIYKNGEYSCYEHTWNAWIAVEAPTCLTGGTNRRRCSECPSVEEVDLPALGHDLVDIEAKEADCVSGGHTAHKDCSRCNYVEGKETTDALGHTEVIDEAVAPTCTATGLTEGKHCSVCNEILVAQTEIAKLPHMETTIPSVDATCTATGLTESKYCSVCDTVLVAQEVVPALGHTEVIDEAVAPTCTATGLTEGKHCFVCNEILVAQEIVPALGHTEVIDEAVAPTCTTTGLTEGKHCSVCYTVIVPQTEIAKLPHTEAILPAVDATCTTTGLTEGKHCSVCYTVIVPQTEIAKLPHTEAILPAVDATCTATGRTEGKYCSVCNEVLVVPTEIVKLPHEEVIISSVDATCTATGLTAGKYCFVCNTVIIERTETPKLPHTEATIPAVDATCTATGLTEGKYCSVCNEILVEQTATPKLPHIQAIIPAVDATCTATGHTESKYCSVCETVFVAQETIPMIDCIASEWIVDAEATKTEDGKRHKECTMCGKTMAEEILYATGSLGLEYILNDDGKSYSIKGIGTCTDADVIIPNMYNGLPVTEMAEFAFRNNTIETLTLPSSMNKVNIFIHVDVKAIYISSWEQYYNMNFSSMYPLHADKLIVEGTHVCDIEELIVPSGITKIGASQFQDWQFSKAVLPEGVTYIGDYSFSNRYLTDVYLPQSIEKIEYCAFITAESLKNIYYDGTVEQWNAIVKGGAWDSMTGDYTIYCTDGEIAKDGTVTICKLEFTLNEDGESYSVTDILAYRDVDVVIPSEHNGLPVTNISSYAFSGCTNLKSIEIPNSITSIGDWAFYNCTSLKSITIPDSVTSIGNYTFYKCRSLASVTIGDSVTSIGYYAFRDCTYLTSIVIPNSVTIIDDGAFSGCSSLESITLPFVGRSAAATQASDETRFGYIFGRLTYTGGVADMDDQYYKPAGCHDTFYIPQKLKTVTITGETTIFKYAFKGCNNITTVNIGDNVTSVGEYAFSSCDSLTDVIIGDSVTSIGKYAFFNCAYLANLTIGNSVTSIGEAAFSACTSLTNVTISDSVKSIGKFAFSGCDSMVVNEYGNAYYLGNDSNPYLVLVKVKDTQITSCEINSDTKIVLYGAFSGCSMLESITLPFVGGSSKATISSDSTLFGYIFGGSSYDGGVKTVQYYASSYSATYYIPETLKTVTITGGNLYYGAFYNCNNITTINLGSGVTSIGDWAFYNCTSIASVTIPDSVTGIGGSAFSGCSSLESITIPDSVTSINYHTFYNCTSLTSVTIGNSVTSIGEYTFEGCTSLVSIEIPASVIEVGRGAFLDCNSLKDVYYGGDVIGWLAINFKGSDSHPMLYGNSGKNLYFAGELVTTLIIPDSVTNIPNYAFSNCTSLVSIEIPNSVTSIAGGAFSGCSSLENMTLPFVGGSASATEASYSTVLGYIFGMSSYEGSVGIKQYFSWEYNPDIYYIPEALKTVTITGGNLYYGAFYDCDNITTITLGDDVTNIGEYAFYDCAALTNITIGNSVTSIGYYAFSNCTTLKNITIPDAVTSIGKYTFCNCPLLASVTIGNSVTSIGDYAFYDCTSLTSINFGGTIDQWNAISKDSSWDYNTGSYTIYCTDGEIAKDGTVTRCTTISIDNVVVADDGSEVTFDVCIKNNPGIMNMVISMSVDDEVFGFKTAVKGDALPSSTFTKPGSKVTTSPYNFLFDAMEITDEDKTDGVLFTVTLTVKDSSAIGNYDIIFSYVEGDIVDENFEAIDIKINNGEVTLN